MMRLLVFKARDFLLPRYTTITIGRHDYKISCLAHKIVSMLAQSKYYTRSKAVITYF